MRIGLNAINFVSGAMGGVETYFRNLLRYIQQVDNENSYRILCDPKNAKEFDVSGEKFGFQFFDYRKPSLKWFCRGVVKNICTVDILADKINKLPLDVIHCPFSILTPIGISKPTVLTFWDMQHEFFPEFFSAETLNVRKKLYLSSTKRATRIIVNAEFTKQCLVDRYGIERHKIDVVYSGYGPEYRIIEDNESLEIIQSKYGLDRPFIFYPAASWPHKNHSRLLLAVKLMIETYAFDGDLVLTGIAFQAHENIKNDILKLGLAERVKVLGYLPAEELPCLYNLARVMAFPSLFEGFGIPLVEAMACGCPIACSNVTSMPEVLGDAGVLFDPFSTENIAEMLWRVWSDQGTRDLIIAHGLKRASLFRWEDTAKKTVDVYRNAMLSN